MLSLLFWQETKLRTAAANTKAVDAKRYQTNEISISSVTHQLQERKVNHERSYSFTLPQEFSHPD